MLPTITHPNGAALPFTNRSGVYTKLYKKNDIKMLYAVVKKFFVLCDKECDCGNTFLIVSRLRALAVDTLNFACLQFQNRINSLFSLLLLSLHMLSRKAGWFFLFTTAAAKKDYIYALRYVWKVFASLHTIIFTAARTNGFTFIFPPLPPVQSELFRCARQCTFFDENLCEKKVCLFQRTPPE